MQNMPTQNHLNVQHLSSLDTQTLQAGINQSRGDMIYGEYLRRLLSYDDRWSRGREIATAATLLGLVLVAKFASLAKHHVAVSSIAGPQFELRNFYQIREEL